MIHHKKLVTLPDYEKYIGAQAIDRIQKKAKALGDLHVSNVNSTYYGGGVAAILSSMTTLMNTLGIRTGWRVVQGMPDFFGITKKMHNALQGGKINISALKKQLYEEVVYENSLRNHLSDHDIVIVHDPQPLPLIQHYQKRMVWLWRCHIDLSRPHPQLWNYLKQFVEKYDAVIFSMEEFRQNLKTPQVFFLPAIDPFTIKNEEMSQKDIKERFAHHKIPTDLPLVVQVSRFDHWKDPEGVIKAFEKARKKVDCTLVLIGNAATDDPEGQEVYEKMLKHRDERIIISVAGDDSALINALQRSAAVVLQKSIREGFGLTVAEAMWKGTPVIGGNVGGIRHQIEDGKNGFLVNSIDEAADRIVQLVKNKTLRERMGRRARETVKKRFLLSRLLEQYLDLFSSFETVTRLKRYYKKYLPT